MKNNYYSQLMDNFFFTGFYKSDIGILKVTASDKAVKSIYFMEKKDGKIKSSVLIDDCLDQLDEYFRGKRKVFQIKLDPDGTEFQKTVWDALRKIAYGSTRSYKDISEAIKRKNAFRAVGNANNKNKISIIIPCHRVIGQDGSLAGYGGGIWRKEWLLNHERKHL